MNIAVLRDTKIKDKNGNESNVWDALTAIYNPKYNQWELQLKSEFKTKENVENWEEGNGENYFEFKSRSASVITDIHGDFDPRSGMKLKTDQLGQIISMFKTWLPRQFYNMFAKEEIRLARSNNYKGRFKSYSPVLLSETLGVIGAINFGLTGLPVGIAFGLAIKKLGTSKETGMSFIKELVFINKVLARKMLGFPVNFVSRKINNKNVIDNNYDSFYKNITNKEFTKQDFDNYIANMHHLALLLTMFGLYLAANAAFWEDDDDENSTQRRMCNFFSNTFLNFSSQLSAYIDPVESGKMIATTGLFRLFTNIGKLIDDFNDFLHGEDIIPTGIHAGESAFTNQLKKTFLPGIFKSPFSFGVESQMEEKYLKSPYDRYFWGEEKVSKKEIIRMKAIEKRPLNIKLKKEIITEQQYENEVKKLNKQFKRRKGQTFKNKLEDLKIKQKLKKEEDED